MLHSKTLPHSWETLSGSLSESLAVVVGQAVLEGLETSGRGHHLGRKSFCSRARKNFLPTAGGSALVLIAALLVEAIKKQGTSESFWAQQILPRLPPCLPWLVLGESVRCPVLSARLRPSWAPRHMHLGTPPVHFSAGYFRIGNLMSLLETDPLGTVA